MRIRNRSQLSCGTWGSSINTDCPNGNREALVCVAASGSDSDSIQNQDESDVDCGGVCGATCDAGESCLVDGDCVDGDCSGGVCQAPGTSLAASYVVTSNWREGYCVNLTVANKGFTPVTNWSETVDLNQSQTYQIGEASVTNQEKEGRAGATEADPCPLRYPARATPAEELRMKSRIAEAIALKQSPVAVIFTNEKPATAMQFKEGKGGCVASMMVTVTKGRWAVFDRKTFGCPGGGTGLGFGNCYGGFPIERLLSTGGRATLPTGAVFDMHEGERFHADPEVSERWVRSLPFRDAPTEYIVLKPFEAVAEEEKVALVIMLVTPDQLSALATLAGFRTGAIHTSVSPWGAACQSMLFAYAEGEKAQPAGVIGFFDISQRCKVDKDLLSYTMPYRLFVEMEASVDDSFLGTEAWLKLKARQ